MSSARSKRAEVNGWVVLDKPTGITSTQAVSRLKRLYNAKKAGHAGTLDPLASGILPVAFGEATKTVPFVQDGEKSYRFTVQWGAETNTDDAEGQVIAQSETRPTRAAITAMLPKFTGTIEQVPPAFSAVKLAGERAYDLARDGKVVKLVERRITIHALALLDADGPHAAFEMRCGKGAYVRALARDLGRALGCYGHVSALRRTRVGCFEDEDAMPLAAIVDDAALAKALRPVEAGLRHLTRIRVDRSEAARLRRGQPTLLRLSEAMADGQAYAACSGIVIAIGAIDRGELVPSRVFNMPF